MKDIRIGNDIIVTWSLFRGEEAYDLTDLPLTLYLSNAYGKKKVEHFSVDGNKVQWTFHGKDQKNTGKYSLILVVNEGGLGMQSTDVCDFVQLVSCSCQVSGSDESGVQTETIQLSSDVDFPPIVIDSELSEHSANPVQNAVVTKAINELKITDSPIVKGDAENSAVLKGGNNKVISEGSVALGKDNIVGLKGFYYKHIRFVSRTLANIYLSETQVTPTITTGGEIKDTTIKPADYLSKDDIISIVNDNKYNDVAVINNMSEGMIQIKWLSEAPFESIKIETNPSPEDYSVYCLDKPTQGISDLGKYSFANGTDNKAINTYTEVSGKGNIAKGKFAKVWGKNNKGGYNTTTFGTNNVNLADNSLVNGTNNTNEGSNSVIHGNKNKNYGKRAFVVGNENITYNENEAAFGKYNNSENDTHFSIGIGTSEDDRKNAFEVKQNGDIYIEGVEGSIQSKIVELSEEIEHQNIFIEDLQNTKIDKEADDYYPQLSVGVADNLSGVDVVESEFTTRQSGGGAILDGTARIEAIKGNSVVWNQLLDTSDYISHQNGIDVTKDDKNNFVVNGTTGDSDAWIKCHTGLFTLVQGHKYLVTGCPKGGSGTTYSLVEGNGVIQPDFGDGYISECSRDIATVMYIVVRKNTTVTNLKYCPLVYDLTKMFGAGNEPITVEDFNKRMPIGVDPMLYNEGQMINLNPSGIKSYSADEEPIERFQDLSFVNELFPDGMKSTGAVSDEIRWNTEIQKWEKIQRVEEVNLGELNYSKSSLGEHRFYTIDLQDKIAKNTESLISARFIYGQPDDNKTNVITDTIGTVFFSLPSCTDGAAFKEAVQGVTLCYELATPKTTILDEDFSRETGLNVDFNLDYEVWNGGTEELVADNPSSALKADIVYGFNAYGKIKELEGRIDNLGTGGGGTGGSTITVDSALSDTSTNPVQNKVINEKLTELSAKVGKKQDTITDLETIRSGAAKGATALQSVPDTYATKEYVANLLGTIINGDY